jgi:hypothetical protein
MVLVAGLSLAAWLIRRASVMQVEHAAPEQAHIVLPLVDVVEESSLSRTGLAASTVMGRLLRKVGRNQMISVGGKLYGPLDAGLIGRQVEVENRDAQVVVWSEQHEVGRFERQG